MRPPSWAADGLSGHTSLFLNGHQSYWISVPPLGLPLTSITSLKALSSNVVTLGGGQGFNMNVGDTHASVHNMGHLRHGVPTPTQLLIENCVSAREAPQGRCSTLRNPERVWQETPESVLPRAPWQLPGSFHTWYRWPPWHCSRARVVH